MFKKDIESYVAGKWQDDKYIRPISEVSKPKSGSDIEKIPLVDRCEKIFDFDKISENIHKKNKPQSVDGLFFCKNTAYFVEFKTGFKSKITKNNFNKEKALCYRDQSVCDEFEKMYTNRRKKETDELKSSVRFKAVESYITFEKQILPLCNDVLQKNKIVLIVVIDEDGIDQAQSHLWDVCEKYTPPKKEKEKSNNCFDSLSSSLQLYIGKQDKQSPPVGYFYDDIMVFSAKGFEKFFDELSPDMINPKSSKLQPA